ncbi:MAG: nodulation protein NfeD [Candidatus Omnitrophica bacterium]|nr:nodulation protein NfeD [Candidatus Omnitrophota bacterium]
MKNLRLGMTLFLPLLISLSFANQVRSAEVVVVPIKGSINPAVTEMFLKTLREAEQNGAAAVVIRLDTPGGLLTSTREIVKGILNSKVPVIAYVSPAGAQCASAGTFIALACPVLAMASGTNIGAAHPVSPIGKMDKTMEEKVVNDASAWITSLALKWGRNAQWAEKAVRQSVSINENEAVTLKVADLTAENITDLLSKIDNRVIRLDSNSITLRTKSAQINEVKLNFRQQILQSVSDPNIAYILLLLGILGIIFEFSAPGIGFPAIVGLICLLLAFYGLSALPVNIAGVALVFIAVGFFVLEAHAHSFGLLGLGGIVSLAFGSLFLIKPFSYLNIASRISSLLASFIFAALLFIIVKLAYKAMRRKVTTGKEGLIGETGDARTDLAPEGTIYIHGEYWTARTSDGSTIKKGEKVRAEQISGHILLVSKIIQI